MSESELRKRIYRAMSSQQVENVKAMHSYLHARADGTTEWSTIWSKSADTAWAHGFGCMRGFDQIWWNSVTKYDATAFLNYIRLAPVYPQIGGKDPRPLNEAAVHTLATDVIEISGDGLSARASFLTPGIVFSMVTDTGKRFFVCLWERYGSDFVYEDGRWVYLHEQVCPDIFTRMDCDNWAHTAWMSLVDKNTMTLFQEIDSENENRTDPFAALELELKLTDPGPLHEAYSPVKPPQDTVPWPEPYEHLDPDNCYCKKRRGAAGNE